jgi:hypothetical protein
MQRPLTVKSPASAYTWKNGSTSHVNTCRADTQTHTHETDLLEKWTQELQLQLQRLVRQRRQGQMFVHACAELDCCVRRTRPSCC